MSEDIFFLTSELPFGSTDPNDGGHRSGRTRAAETEAWKEPKRQMCARQAKPRERAQISSRHGAAYASCVLALWKTNVCIFLISQREGEHKGRGIKPKWWNHWTRGWLEKEYHLLMRTNRLLKLNSYCTSAILGLFKLFGSLVNFYEQIPFW